MRKGLTGFQLKLIAIAAMLIDHVAWAFVDTGTSIGQLMHFVGRITGPTMCFFIAEGYRHTRSLPRYLARLAVFAALSQVPFAYYNMGRASLFPLNVIYTLGLGLLAVHCMETVSESKQWLVITALVLMSVPADWGIYGVFLCMAFYGWRENWRKLSLVVSAGAVGLTVMQVAALMAGGYDFWPAVSQSWFHLGIVINVFLLPLYNGERGGGAWGRWIFYVFYPLHLAILGWLRWGL